MEVKPGYRQTEVGVIPEDWDVSALGGLIDLLTGFPFPSKGYSQSGIRLLRGSNVKRNRTDWSDDLTQYWPEVAGDIRRYLLRSGDIVVAMDGSLVGRSFTVLKNDDVPALLLQRVARIRSEMASQAYLKEWICSQYFTEHCDAVKTTTAIPHISPTDINNFRIPLPPTQAEQEAIAGALSDADALIESLEQLVAKKRQIKHGAMQELLTGQKRLPGFTGEWETKRLGELGTYFSGGTPNTSVPEYYGGEIPWITSSDCNAGRITSVAGRITPAGVASSATKWIKAGTVLMALYGATAGVVAVSEIDATINQAVLAIVLHHPVPEFMFQKLGMMKEWIIATYTQGGQPNLSGAIVKSIELKLPHPTEQQAIAAILSDMDAGIAAMEVKLAKARLVKQGMMQELLTGRIRLK